MSGTTGMCVECDPSQNRAWNSEVNGGSCECNAATFHYVNPDNTDECILCDSSLNKKLEAGRCVCDVSNDFHPDAEENCHECLASANKAWNYSTFICECDSS